MYSVQILILIFLVASTAALYEDEYSKDLFHASDVRTFDSIETEFSEENQMNRVLTKSPPRFYKCIWKICSKPLNKDRHKLIEKTNVRNAEKVANFVNNSILSLISKLQKLFKNKQI